MTHPLETSVQSRARLSQGSSNDAIHRMVADEIRRRNASGTLYDIGCGTGALRAYLPDAIDQYIGVDVVRYEDFIETETHRFAHAPLDQSPWPIAEAVCDVAVAIETIEHLENPRQFFRELSRITRPGGLIIITTPNQLSLLSKACLLFKNQFNAFQERPGLYPAHITALLEIDLLRIAGESGAVEASVAFSNRGRLPGTSNQWPGFCRGRPFSDNVMLSCRRSG